MVLPSPDTPLYNHPLPDIEQWLTEHGCEQDSSDRHFWQLKTSSWEAEISLDIDSLKVRYFNAGDGGRDIQRSFKYSLTRQDLDEVIFSGP